MQGLGSFMAAIRYMESSRGSFEGNYSVYGRLVKGDRARGAYQIMSKNWPSWSAQAGIPGADWRDPAAQDRVAAHKMQEYYNRYGTWWQVALAWYAGPGTADITVRNGYRGPQDIKTDSLRDYVYKVMGWQQEAAAAGWDARVRGIIGGVQAPSYVAPDMAAVRYPNTQTADPRGYSTVPQQLAGYAAQSYAQLQGMVTALADQIAQGERVDIDEMRLDPEQSTPGDVMSRDVSKITLDEPEQEAL